MGSPWWHDNRCCPSLTETPHSKQDGDTVPDGLRLPDGQAAPATAIVKGDGKEACIAAASIIATVSVGGWFDVCKRDR
jgi:ribonuclease HII